MPPKRQKTNDSQVTCDLQGTKDSRQTMPLTAPKTDRLSSLSTPVNAGNKRKRRRSSEAFDKEFVLRTFLEDQEDDIDLYCQYIASRLRCMTREQRLAAQLLIDDVVYMGQLGLLNPHNPRDIFADHSSNRVHSQNLSAGPIQPGYMQSSNVVARQGNYGA